jgi:hypothetical protein
MTVHSSPDKGLLSSSSLNLVPPAPFPRPLASDADDIPPVIVDEADLPRSETQKRNSPKVEPLASHPQGVDTGEGSRDGKTLNGSDDGIIRDSLTLGELRKYVEGAAFKVKVPDFGGWELMRETETVRV